MPRIDAHVHAFPDRLALAVRSRLSERAPLPGSPLLADVAAAVLEQGFDGAWILPYAHRPGVAASVNEWMSSAAAEFPWLTPGATIHPGDEDLPQLVERALVELRLGVVKLHCSVGQFSPADRRLEPLWAVAASVGVPVVVHAGQLTPGETSPEEIDELSGVLRVHPSLRLVIAHCGFPATDRAVELMARHDNLFADLTPVWDRPVEIDADDLIRFSGRFLFGSDSPNNPALAGEQASRFEEMGLPDAARDLLLGGAAALLTPMDG